MARSRHHAPPTFATNEQSNKAVTKKETATVGKENTSAVNNNSASSVAVTSTKKNVPSAAVRSRSPNNEEGGVPHKRIKTSKREEEETKIDHDDSASVSPNNGETDVDRLIRALASGDTERTDQIALKMKEAREQKLEQVRNNKYRFANTQYFAAAMELYNRTHCSEATVPGHYVADEFWMEKPVLGRHKNPCDKCECDFNLEPSYFLDDAASKYAGSWFHASSNKLCAGCLGRRLKDHLEASGLDETTQPRALFATLEHLREQQPYGIMTGRNSDVYRKPRQASTAAATAATRPANNTASGM